MVGFSVEPAVGQAPGEWMLTWRWRCRKCSTEEHLRRERGSQPPGARKDARRGVVRGLGFVPSLSQLWDPQKGCDLGDMLSSRAIPREAGAKAVCRTQ